MRAPANPYRWNVVNPSVFFGRRALAGELVDRLIGGERFAVTGGRRMGKTTLLRKVEAGLRGFGDGEDRGLRVLPIFVDANQLSAGSADGAYRLLVDRLNHRTYAVSL